jgi:hypothetical protein
MSLPDIESLELLYKAFWGRRDRIRELGIVVETGTGRTRKGGPDPYNLTEYFVDADGKDILRCLKLPGICLFPFLIPSSKILLRGEYVYIYKQLLSIFESDFETCGGAVVTGYSGIGKKCDLCVPRTLI